MVELLIVPVVEMVPEIVPGQEKVYVVVTGGGTGSAGTINSTFPPLRLVTVTDWIAVVSRIWSCL